MSTVEPPSLGRYLLGCVIMLAAVVAPLALAWLRTTHRGAPYSRGLGCASLAACGFVTGCCVRCITLPAWLLRPPQRWRWR